MDRGADFPVRHAHLPQDLVAALVFISFGDLLVVDDEGCGQQEQQSQEDA